MCAALLAVVLVACQHPGPSRPPPPPSIVLAVLDTTRADAVSAYGYVAATTTPNVDALARDGILYEHAYANANWTVPSHATLFTGLLPIQHGVQDRHRRLNGIPTMAELLGRAGYETVAIIQNPWLHPAQGLTQGFDKVRFPQEAMHAAVQRWLAERGDDNRPFFLFLNLMDAHYPYKVRKSNSFLPAGASAEDARVAAESNEFLCKVTPQDRQLQILHGLYLGNVQAADATLATALEALRALNAPIVTIVTSDHGEHFGEHGIIHHLVGIHHALSRVPLIVHGLPGVEPARIAAPVQLADIMPTVLTWARIPIPNGLAGEPLPTAEPQGPSQRTIMAEFHDGYQEFLNELPVDARKAIEASRQYCGAGDRVDGDMRAVIRFPFELMWYEKHPARLFDLRTDRAEQRDLAAAMPERVAELMAEMRERLSLASARQAPRVELDAARVEQLRALGYLGGEAVRQEGSRPAPKLGGGDSALPNQGAYAQPRGG